jgi:hypothetical protein
MARLRLMEMSALLVTKSVFPVRMPRNAKFALRIEHLCQLVDAQMGSLTME